MDNRIITITPKGETKQYSVECQFLQLGKARTFLLNESKYALERKGIILIPGCKASENGIPYRINNIWYPPNSVFPFIDVIFDYPL